MGRTQAIAQSLESPTPTHYTWSFPGSPVQVRLGLDVVGRIQKLLEKPSGEHGLLWGRAGGHSTDIDQFTSIPAPQSKAIGEITTSTRPPADSQLVGYYRVHRDPLLRLSVDDVTLAENVLPEPYQVLLLIQPGDNGPATATFFFWDEGKMAGEFSLLEFPFDSMILAIAEQQKIEANRKKLPAKNDSLQENSPISFGDHVSRPAATVRLVTVGLLTLLVAAASLGAVEFFRGRYQLPAAAPSTANATLPSPSSQVLLGLQAQRQNGDLRLTWSRDSAAVANATWGSLSIEDGAVNRKIVLDSTQVRSGSILYAPTSDQVQMQLAVSNPQSNVSESVIVILPKSGEPRVQTIARRSEPAADAEPPSPREAVKPFSPPAIENVPQQSSSAFPVSDPPAVSLASVSPAPVVPGIPQTAVAAPPMPEPATPAPAVQKAAPPQPVRSEPQPGPKTAASLPVYYPPVIASAVTPVYPNELRNMGLPVKTIEVKVAIDVAGRVSKAEALPPKVWVPQALVQAALEAARIWRFKPARRGDSPVASEMVLQFAFKSPALRQP